MTILDRYLLKMFLQVFLVCFLSFTGLFIVIHLFSNLDELAALAEASSWSSIMWEFYSPRVAENFGRTAPVLVLVSGVFSVSMMQRNSELTAIEAGGITKARALRSIILASLFIIGLTVVNREWIIPQFKPQLVRTPKNWTDEKDVEMTVQEDFETGIKIRGHKFYLSEKRIAAPDIQLPLTISRSLPRISAKSGTLVPASQENQHPAGIWLQGVTQPINLASTDSIVFEDRPLFLSPKDHGWLKPDECFLAVELDADEVAYGKRMAQYRATSEMIAALRRPKAWGGQNEVDVHARLLLPVLDVTLLMLGLPLIASGGDRNIFVSAGLGFLIVGSVLVVNLACRSLGTYALLQPAALAAWMPLIIFVPLAVLSLRKLKT